MLPKLLPTPGRLRVTAERRERVHRMSGNNAGNQPPDMAALIERVFAEYRDELLADMHRYHGCDRYDNERACRADVFRVDRVIHPVVRKMLEDLADALVPAEVHS